MLQFTFIFSLLFSLSLFAADSKSVKPVTEKQVDKKMSTFKWTGTKHFGDSHFGTVPLKTGKATLKNGKVTGGTFVIDMTKIDVKDLTGKKKNDLQTHLISKDFFDVNNKEGTGSTATLVLNEVKNGKAKGMLTIKGITKPIEVPYTQKENHFSGTMTFDRTKYNINFKSKSVFKALVNQLDKVIKDEITIEFKVILI